LKVDKLFVALTRCHIDCRVSAPAPVIVSDQP
jgi:hypothetical protein